MRTRDKRISDYGITECEKEQLLKLARKKEYADLIRTAARMARPDLEQALFTSLAFGKGYEAQTNIHTGGAKIYCGRNDFYGYRRKAIFLFKRLLVAEGIPSPEEPHKTSIPEKGWTCQNRPFADAET